MAGIILKHAKSLLATLLAIIIVFAAASLLDIIIATINSRFYTTAAFIVIFGVAGVFAATLGFMYGMEAAAAKNEFTRWSLIIFIILAGLVFFFFLAKIEGGDYEPAFKAYGATMTFSTLLFVKGKVG
ncbi:MAG: hypothetical protein H7Y01_02205 [Ferruginibacter sp.]|nr:hypothetical protein [Chitinophagaceae bacterium]